MTSPDFFDPVGLLPLFQTTASETFFEQLCRKQHLKVRRGIYTVATVVWLMIFQRLSSRRTLSAAVQWMARNAGSLQPLASTSRRVRDDRISTGTGGYSQARQKLPIPVAIDVTDHLFEQLRAQLQEQLPDVPRPVFVIDGTTLRLAHEKELVVAFPPGHNQHGENHWPTMLLVALHDAHTGLATRPQWASMYGPDAVGEQELARQALTRLPADAVVMGDGNFGIFAFAYAVRQTQRPLLLRLTAARAQKVLGGAQLRPGRRRKVVWEASAWDGQAHPDLPQGARVEGWVVACRNPARRKEMLYFFTTLDLKPSRILALYKLRWNIETDLRSLKRTVGLHQIPSKSRAMVEKEVLLAVSAYNLIRAVMYLAARRAGLTPRQLSFSAAQDAVLAAWPHLQRAATPAQYRRELERLIETVAKAQLPNRSRRRSYPRETWGRGGHFPFRRSAPGKEASQ